VKEEDYRNEAGTDLWLAIFVTIKRGEIMNRIFLVSLLLLAGVNVAFGQSTAYQDSAKIEKLFDDYFREYIGLNPQKGSELGLSRESGYYFERAALDDYSDSGIKANFDLTRKYLDELEKIDQNKITKSQSIDARILTWFLKIQLEGEKFVDHKYYIDHLFGVHSQLVNLMTAYHTVENLQDAYDYLSRLEKIPIQLRQTQQRIDNQEEKGIRSPAFIIDRTIQHMQQFRSTRPKENFLYADFTGKVNLLSSIYPDTVQELFRRAEAIIGEVIYPAYDEFIQRLTVSAQNADSLTGVWKLPNGVKYYQYCLKSHTSSSATPDEVFQLGLKEVKSLQGKARVLLDSLAISEGETFGELMSQYRSTWRSPELESRFFYPDNDQKRQMVLDDYRSLVDGAWARLPQAFSYVPKSKVAVESVPQFLEAGGLTYYEPASVDGKRKAVFHVNMGYTMAKPGMPSLTYHETVPGHHYQFAVQQELTQGRMFKNLFFITGYAEGWAMYVQALADELGWLPDIYSRIEELNSQLFRAVRVVLDAGVHSQKWTKESALQYMQDNLGWNSGNEIDRYAVWPGQACSYTVGRLKIQELREKAKNELGPKFDLKEFHMAVLENGSLPLDLLEEIMDDYIVARR
jgi:uncharacterized protein (DUF885 family)